jgi:isocitrate dehydrogenase kinase/phosphatase
MQGFMKNYAEFLTEMSQGATTLFSQGQQAFMQQAKPRRMSLKRPRAALDASATPRRWTGP